MTTKALTLKDFHRAAELLRENSFNYPLCLVENRDWYLSDDAKALKFDCTEEELLVASFYPDGFIKSSCGVRLYLSKHLKAV